MAQTWPHEDSPQTPFDIGSRVVLHGLKSAAQYNGHEGVIVAAFPDIARMGVRLVRDQKDLKVAPANIAASKLMSLLCRAFGEVKWSEVAPASEHMLESQQSCCVDYYFKDGQHTVGPWGFTNSIVLLLMPTCKKVSEHVRPFVRRIRLHSYVKPVEPWLSTFRMSAPSLCTARRIPSPS